MMNPTSFEKVVPSFHSAFSRRNWLKAVGYSLAGASYLNGPLIPLAADDKKPKAKSNLPLGIMSNVYSSLPLNEAVRRIKDDGFVNVVTDYVFADIRFDMANPDWEAAKKIVAAFENQEIQIAAVYGYYNVVSPNPAVRKQGEQRMEFFFANWKRLGCPVISTETGTFNAQSEWLISPKNDTEEAYLECRNILKRLTRSAEKTGAVITIEPYWQNVISSIDRAERLFHEVESPALKLVMDPCNYFRKEDLPQMQSMLEEMFRRLGDRIVIAHAKDVKAAATGTDLPAAGQGILDYPLYLRLLSEQKRNIPLLVEHLTLDDVSRCRNFMRGQLDKDILIRNIMGNSVYDFQ